MQYIAISHYWQHCVAYNFTLDVEGYPGAVVNLFVVVGLFILRWKSPNVPRPFKTWIIVPTFFLAGQVFLVIAPFLRPPGGVGDTPPIPYWVYPIVGIAILIGGVLYWTIWRVVLPKVGGFQWVRKTDTLSHGTVYTHWVKGEKAL